MPPQRSWGLVAQCRHQHKPLHALRSCCKLSGQQRLTWGGHGTDLGALCVLRRHKCKSPFSKGVWSQITSLLIQTIFWSVFSRANTFSHTFNAGHLMPQIFFRTFDATQISGTGVTGIMGLSPSPM